MRVAILSNINMTPVERFLKQSKNIDVFETQGYGNELGIMLNQAGALYEFKPDYIFLFADLMEIIGHDLKEDSAYVKIIEWFDMFENALKDEIIYYLSDSYLFGFEMGVVLNTGIKFRIEKLWDSKLEQTIREHRNVRLFAYKHIIENVGEQAAFSMKMWYLGKIIHSTEVHRAIADVIRHKIEMDTTQPKKVLLLDLDNTMWGGLAGENDTNPITLSDDSVGLAYKNFQRVIYQMKMQGVILGIVSKNNPDDAMEIINNHPHMVLRESDFAIEKINWNNKNENISEIAEDLNLGLDSFVFFDDNPAERSLIQETLPDVLVPDFPDNPEDLAGVMVEIYYKYFEKAVITKEDQEKTELYRGNQKRKELQSKTLDFDSYLTMLEINLIRLNPMQHVSRMLQLINKTNQFNLTTKRFAENELIDIIQDDNKEVFLYQVTDKFGDNGIVAVAIADYDKEAVISEFAMSCRVMGRNIENAIIEDIEKSARSKGYDKLVGMFKPTKKNKPVENLYSLLGYKNVLEEQDGTIYYSVELNSVGRRNYILNRLKGE